MPEETKRSHWLKYLFRGLLFLLVLIVVFYQQIFFGIVQLVAQEVAKSQAFSLQFKISGSIISTLNIEDLNLKPLPENKKLPLERVEAKRIALRYNLLRLLKKISCTSLKSSNWKTSTSSSAPLPNLHNQTQMACGYQSYCPKRSRFKMVILSFETRTGILR